MYEGDVDRYEEDLLALLRSCYDESEYMPVSDEFLREKLRGLRQYLREGKTFLYGAVEEESGRLASFSWAYEIQFQAEKRCHAAYAAVAPWASGQGLFAKTIRASEEDAYRMGYTCMDLAVSTVNEKVIAIHKKHGYKEERVYLKKTLGPGPAAGDKDD